MHLIPAGIIKFPKKALMLHNIPNSFLPKMIFVERLSPKKEMINLSVLAGIMIFGWNYKSQI
jgi:hypothetical protein